MDIELSQLQSLRIKFGTQICLRNIMSRKYFQYEIQTQSANAQAPPPIVSIPQQQSTAFAMGNQAILRMFKNTTYSKYRIIPAQSQSSSSKNKQSLLKDYLCFGSKVHLVNQKGQYLTSSSKNQLKFDKPTSDQGMNGMLFKSATFTVNDIKNSPIIGEIPINVYDNVVLKNVYGKTLTLLQDKITVNASGDRISDNVLWNIMKADVPYVPLYIYTDSVLGKFLFLQHQRDKRGVEQSMRKKVKQLNSESILVQEALLVEDILDVMLGFDGIYIKRRPKSHHFIIEPYLQNPSCSLALTQMAYKILDIPAYYYVVQNYVSYYSLQQGTVCQALCGGLRHLIKQYKMMVIQLDQQTSEQGMTLQKMWYRVQDPLKVIKSLYELVSEAQGLKGGNLISCIMRFLHHTTDDGIAKIYNFLFGKTMKVYIEMIAKWIYEGVIEDKYQQFLVKAQQGSSFGENQKSNYQQHDVRDKQGNLWTSWQQKYMLRENQIPNIFQRNADLILVTGKYLNIMKQCKKLPEHPFKGDILRPQNIQKCIQMQDFTPVIEKAYEWTTQQILNLVFKDYRLCDVLKSMKGYFFMEFGDLFIQFMEVAQKQLVQLKVGNKSYSQSYKKQQLVSVQKLQSLFELLIRTSSANNDPFKEEISCKIDNQSIYEQIQKIKTLQPKAFQYDYKEKTYVKPQSRYVDFLTLDFRCTFPLNLIINGRTISKYQCLFRYLFWAKFMEKEMNKLWLEIQGVKPVTIDSLKIASAVNQRMINFAKNLFYYLSFQIIQRNWIQFMSKLQQVKTFQEIIRQHDQFLNKCLHQTLLTNKILFPMITIDIGNTCKNFGSVEEYLDNFSKIREQVFNSQKYQGPQKGILLRKKQRNQEFEKYCSKKAEQFNLREIMTGYSDKFDSEMRKLLREIYAMVGKQETHLVGLLDRLDEQKYYNRKYGGQMAMTGQILGNYGL